MLEKMADLEVLEVVATLDFAHRNMSQAALLPVIVDWRKILKPNPFFMELTAARQPIAGALDWNDLIIMKPTVGFMLPSAGVTPAPSENH